MDNFNYYSYCGIYYGKDLREYSFKFSFIKSMILKLSIYTLSRKHI
jgi:hypothetical protein